MRASIVVAVAFLAVACSAFPPGASSHRDLSPEVTSTPEASSPAEATVTPVQTAPASASEVGWWLVATEESGGDLADAYSVDVALSSKELRDVWKSHELAGSPPDVDFDQEIVAAFGHGHGSSCPELVLADVVIDARADIIYSRDAVAPTPSDPLGQRPCTADLAGSTIFFVALDRGDLPTEPFTVYLENPDQCAGLTCVSKSVNLAVPTATVAPEPTGYTVNIASGLHPKWTAADAAATAMRALLREQESLGQVLAEPRVLAVAAMLGRDVPNKFGGRDSERARDVVWVVECQGTFVQTSFVIAPWMGTNGYFVYDDTGKGIGFGASLTIPPPSFAPPT